MKKLVSLKDLHIEIIGGQIMSRVTVRDDSKENVIETRKVVVPKAILSDGSIDISELPEEKLKVTADPKRLTTKGDIVLKLSTPYDAALVDENSEGCLVPSFCAIIKTPVDIDVNYLLAFLNSNYCKEQFKTQVAGAAITILSVGKVASALMPVPSLEEQQEIGANYIKAQEKLKLVKQITILEAKRNDIVFKDMVKDYE